MNTSKGHFKVNNQEPVIIKTKSQVQMKDIPQKATQYWRKKSDSFYQERIKVKLIKLKTSFPQIKIGCACNSRAIFWWEDKSWKITTAV